MKNIILINTNGEVLVSSINDGTNTLYINGTLIDSSQWIGSGSYTATVEGHAITIAKAPDLNGNIQLIRVSEYNYRLIKLRSFNNVLDVYQDGISVVGSDGIARITGGSSGANKNTWYGSSNTVAGTQTKVVTTTSGNFELEAGNIVVVKFTYAQTYSGSYKLDVDGTGAVTVMSKGTTGSERYCYVAGEAVAHVYDGTNFIAINEGIASTTYYGIKVNMGERDLTSSELSECNSYNTRCATFKKLPVGPICNPSIESINASINPIHSNYYYFVADKNKKIYFSRNSKEHLNTISDLKSNGLWFTY